MIHYHFTDIPALLGAEGYAALRKVHQDALAACAAPGSIPELAA
jgi:hypothetical protein